MAVGLHQELVTWEYDLEMNVAFHQVDDLVIHVVLLASQLQCYHHYLLLVGLSDGMHLVHLDGFLHHASVVQKNAGDYGVLVVLLEKWEWM